MTVGIKQDRFVVDGVDVNYSYIDRIYDGVMRKTVDRWTVLLPGSGCEWARKKHKGCTFCSFNARIDELTGGRLLPHDEMMSVFEAAKEKIGKESPEILALFNGGNFINDREIVASAQYDIFRFCSTHPTINTVLFETKTEYLTERKVAACLEAIGNKKLRVAIGLECKDDHLRKTVINKGMSKGAYEKTLKKLHSLGIEVQSYIFMKPLTLTERQGIEEAVASIEYAVEAGSDLVMLEAAMVQKGTAFEEAFNRGEFKSPWLWSIREVIEKTRYLDRVNVGVFNEEPRPLSFPMNCDNCSDKFNVGFKIFRETHNLEALLNLNCSCRAEWEKALISA